MYWSSEAKLTSIVKIEQERVISKGGNASLLYLPKEYFTPGEKVSSQLEVDSEGNLKMTLTKKLFNFTCESLRALVGADFSVEFDKTIAGTQIFSAAKGSVSVSCVKSTQDLEPAHATVSRRFSQIRTPLEYQSLMDTLKKLTEKKLDAYIEPEGDLDTINVFKNPQRYGLKDQAEAVEALHETSKKLDFSITVRLNSKTNTVEEIKEVLKELKA